MNPILPAVLLTAAVAGCHNLADNAATPDEDRPAPAASTAPVDGAARVYTIPSVPFRTLLHGVHMVYEGEAQNAVIRSQADWEAFLRAHPHNEPGSFQLDFAREQGVLVQLGSQPTGVIKVEIVSIEERADKFVVHAVRWMPGADEMVTDDIGYPTHYVAMARSDKPVTFAPVVDAKASERQP